MANFELFFLVIEKIGVDEKKNEKTRKEKRVRILVANIYLVACEQYV